MSRSGLTIIEVLIALAILGVLFAVLATTQVTTLHVTRQSREASVATQAAITEIGKLKETVLADFSGYLTCGGTPTVSCSGSPQINGVTVDYTIVGGPNVGSPYAFSPSSACNSSSCYLREGVVYIQADVQAPAAVHLDTSVSCIQQSDFPTVLAPGSCEFVGSVNP